MMPRPVFLALLSLSAVLAAPSALQYDEYTVSKMETPEKRAALLLDRLLVALQRALRDEGEEEERYRRRDRDALRVLPLNPGNVMESGEGAARGGGVPLLRDVTAAALEEDDLNALQRRRGREVRGRVIKCYFNAITCI